MVNVYGPTETTMWLCKSAPLAAGSGAPPIGSPIDAVRRSSSRRMAASGARRGAR